MFKFNKLPLAAHIKLLDCAAQAETEEILNLLANDSENIILSTLLVGADLDRDYFEDEENRCQLLEFVDQGIKHYSAPFISKKK